MANHNNDDRRRDVNVYGKIRFTYFIVFKRSAVSAVFVFISLEQFLLPLPPSDAAEFIIFVCSVRSVWVNEWLCVVACGMAACVGRSRNMKTKKWKQLLFESSNSIVIGRNGALLVRIWRSRLIFYRFLMHAHQKKPLMNFSIVLHYRHLAGCVFSFIFLTRADYKMYVCSFRMQLCSQMNLFRSILSSLHS